MGVIQETTNRPRPAAREPEPRWAAVAALAAVTFTVVTAEMLPVGLLTPVGDALAVSEGTAGLTLTVTGVVAALSAPLVAPLFGRRDRRAVLCALMALLASGNLLAALAPSFAVLIVARVLIGFAMGATWAIAAGLAVRLVPPERVGLANSVIFSGIAVASVLGVPAGSIVGELLGWRASFALAGGLALAVLLALSIALPPLPPEAEVRLRGVLGLLRVPPVATGLALVALLVIGHFAAYTYVRPVLEQVAGVGAGTIGTLLLVYGVAGVVGTLAAGICAVRSPRGTLAAVAAAIAATVAALVPLGGSVASAAALLVVWGVAYGGVSVSAQTWLQAAAPDDREAVASLFAGVFNGAIALGATVGGVAADRAGTEAVAWVACGFAGMALVVAALGRAPGGAAAGGPAR